MPYTTVFFDLDDTLYAPETGIWGAIRERMNRYMLEVLHIPSEQVSALRHFYFETYGTTLRGLQYHYHVDAADFLAYVHDLPIEDILKPDPELRAFLLSIPHPCFVFTNADHRHAERVLSSLGIRDCFEDVIDVIAMDFHCKPETAAYQIALQCAGGPAPQECVYLDDSARNLAPAQQLGFYTVLIGQHAANPIGALAINRPQDLRCALPELWENHRNGRR